jgi:hypothetical protein
VVCSVVCVLALAAWPQTFGAASIAALRRPAVGGRPVRDRLQPVTPRRYRLQSTTVQYGRKPNE